MWPWWQTHPLYLRWPRLKLHLLLTTSPSYIAHNGIYKAQSGRQAYTFHSYYSFSVLFPYSLSSPPAHNELKQNWWLLKSEMNKKGIPIQASHYSCECASGQRGPDRASCVCVWICGAINTNKTVLFASVCGQHDICYDKLDCLCEHACHFTVCS